MNLKGIFDKVGDVAEIAGDFTGNPYLKMGGKVIGAIVDDDEETEQFIEELSVKQLLNLQDAVVKQLIKKLTK